MFILRTHLYICSLVPKINQTIFLPSIVCLYSFMFEIFSLLKSYVLFMATKKNFSLIFSVFLFFLISNGADDTLSKNQSISGDETIVSSGGNFVLGFFSPGNSSNYYIGLWYKKVREQTVVWVANRERPISDKYSSHLKIVDGNLVLVDQSQVTVWSTNTNFTSTNLVAVLLDDGNLVLKDSHGSNSKLWQSFDNPTNTWLPGAKLAYNNRTKTPQRLVSWKNSEDPAPGLYSLELDPIGKQYVILRNRSLRIWISGEWNENLQAWSFVPEMIGTTKFNGNLNQSYVSNINESYFIYSVQNASLVLTRSIMDHTGQFKSLLWLESEHKWNPFFVEPQSQCKVNSTCGAYAACNLISNPFCNCLSGFKSKFEKDWILMDYSGGCVRNIELDCGSTDTTRRKEDKFRKYSSMKLPDNSQSLSVRSVADCESTCLSNCSCTAYAYHDNGCFTWSGDLINMQQLPQDDTDGKVIYIRLDSSEFSKNNKGVYYRAVGGSIAAVLTILSGLIILVVIRRRKRRGTGTGNAKATEGTLVAFGYKDLQSATENFSEKLGRGGFGSVFKGTLADLTVVAVKKLERIGQGEKQFRAEVSTIGNIQHVNLVHLRGFCSHGNERLLVYEYMSNGSLDSHIFNAEKILSWETRYEIALGIAKGLAYLHERCRDCIIHCDIKPENILLAADMCPKVADFGLAKLFGRDFSRVLTTMRGTRGYLAPEWLSGEAVTAKADVYSYGMMLFEIVSGRRNLEQIADATTSFFPIRAARVTITEGDILSLLDTKLNRIANIEQLTNLCRVACWCVQDTENFRPTMGEVVQILEGVLDVKLPPEPQGLRIFTDEQDNIAFFIKSNSSWTSDQSKSSSPAELQGLKTG